VETEILSDNEIEEEVFSDDERSTGHHNGGNGPSAQVYETMIRRTRSTTRKLNPSSAGREYPLRGSRVRSKSQAPHSPEVPKVPEAYLVALKPPDI
jgi:hypothetical protein